MLNAIPALTQMVWTLMANKQIHNLQLYIADILI